MSFVKYHEPYYVTVLDMYGSDPFGQLESMVLKHVVPCKSQVYGKHAGHDCKLATDVVTTTREELRSWSKKLGDNYDLIKKSRKSVIDTKDSILNTQHYVRNRIMKHTGVLNSCMRRREVVLKCEVDERTKKKLELLDAQERSIICLLNFMLSAL